MRIQCSAIAVPGDHVLEVAESAHIDHVKFSCRRSSDTPSPPPVDMIFANSIETLSIIGREIGCEPPSLPVNWRCPVKGLPFVQGVAALSILAKLALHPTPLTLLRLLILGMKVSDGFCYILPLKR